MSNQGLEIETKIHMFFIHQFYVEFDQSSSAFDNIPREKSSIFFIHLKNGKFPVNTRFIVVLLSIFLQLSIPALLSRKLYIASCIANVYEKWNLNKIFTSQLINQTRFKHSLKSHSLNSKLIWIKYSCRTNEFVLRIDKRHKLAPIPTINKELNNYI